MDFYLERALDAIEGATRGMDVRELCAHPPGKWCSAEILEHLLLTFSGTAKRLERCLDAGKPAGSTPNFRQRLAVALVVELGYFPGGLAAPELVKPRGMPAESVLPAIRENLRLLDERFAECERRFGNSVKIADHPILGPLTARQWRKFHWVHTRHHMKQIARLRERTDASG